jgi:hypothetical protein
VQIEEIGVNLRRRNPWEAMDLGGSMLRAWGAPAYRIWLAFYWPVGLLLLAVLHNNQSIALLILWWLKPLFDRLMLFSYSRSMFGHPTTVRDAWRALPGLLRHSGLLSGLTLRRFSLARSLLLPVWQLEQLSGAAARQRCSVLARRARGHAVWLMVVCVHLNVVFWFSLVILIEMLTPGNETDTLSLGSWFNNDLALWQETLGSLLAMAAETLIEPFYVASGFSLYLNRRSELEGWDIELAFRRLSERLAGGAAVLLLACLLGAGLAVTPTPVAATERAETAKTAGSTETAEVAKTAVAPGTAGQPPSAVKQTVERVLADPVFGENHKVKQWRLREEDKKKEKDPPSVPPRWGENLANFFASIGEVLRALAWIVVALAAAALIYFIVVNHERWFNRGGVRTLPPDFLFGLDVRPESLPDDVAAAARAALAAGNVECALSLLYRGALVALLHRERVEFRPGDTEDDCEHRIAGHVAPPTATYFGRLLAAWRVTAYAHRPPAQDELAALCDAWPGHFALVQEVAP